MKKLKQCNCEEHEVCNAETSCFYDFISVTGVPELGTIIIEDINYNERVVICEEHIPELISTLLEYTPNCSVL